MLNRNNKLGAVYVLIVIGLLFIGSGIALGGIQPLAIATVGLTVTVKDSSTVSPLSGVKIEFDQGGTGHVDYTAYTNVHGIADPMIAQGVYTITLTKTGYTSRTLKNVDLRTAQEHGNKYLVYEMDKSNTPITVYGESCVFYFVDSNYKRLVGCTVKLDGKETLSDASGYAIIEDVPQGSQLATFSGRYQSIANPFTFTYFQFGDTVMVKDGENIYTVYVEERTVLDENPPDEPTPSPNPWIPTPSPNPWIPNPSPNPVFPKWLITVGIAILGFAMFAVVFAGSGPELIRAATGR